ncbi:response regulator [Buttiauxella gaviniae]|uniref:response regulator n=1 Tax=Buttiauxella gaviniae TaxID=82990 RepID=UPI00397712D4
MLFDDHPLILHGLNNLLKQEADFAISGYFTHVGDLLSAVADKQPDIIVADFDLDIGNKYGIPVIQQLKYSYPETKIVVLSARQSPMMINAVMHAGANGYVAKNNGCDEVVAALRTVLSGNNYFEPEIALSSTYDRRKPLHLADDHRLTHREKEVLHHFIAGASVNNIALIMQLSTKTVSSHKRSSMKKMGVRYDSELFNLHYDLQKLNQHSDCASTPDAGMR